MTSVASELNALSHLHPQTSRNPSTNGQDAETPFAALLDIDAQQEPPVSKKPQAPAHKQKAHKPDAPSGQRPASKAKDAQKPDSEKSAATDDARSEETGSKDEVQETATDPAKEEEAVEATDVTTDEFLIGETETKAETEAQPAQPAVVAQPQAVALPVAADIAVTAPEGEIDLLAQAATQPVQIPAAEPESAPVTDAPEAVLDPVQTAEAGKKPDVKMPDAKGAETSGQGAAEEAPQIEGKLQQQGDNGEQGKDGDARDAKDAKVEARPRPHNEVKPEAPHAQDSAPATKPAADTAQLSFTPAQVHASATGQAQSASANPVAQAVPVSGLAVEIAAHARAGNNRFEIRLDPPELGRIDVRLDIDREGNVTSRLMIERADTYDLLRRDASTLERALQNAGLKTSDNALEFSLRDQGFAHRDEHAERQKRGAQVIIPDGDDLGANVNPYGRALGLGGGLDIRV